VGAALDLGFDVLQAAIPPDHDYILATTSENNRPVLLQVRGDSITPRSMNELSKIDRIALSPTGSVAAFFSESERRIYAFGNLSQSPILLGKFETGELSSVSVLGISDDGRTVVLGASDGVTGSLFLINMNQVPRLIASMRHPSAVRFLHNSDDAIIADDLDNKVFVLSGGQVFAVATAEDGISAPVGIAVSNDNKKAFVGNSKPGSVTTIELFGRVSEPVPCNCTLTGLHATDTDSVFRLTDFSGTPILLFDGNSPVPRMMFVPVGSQY
jgi:DNA-binding beta-propeller fold protein YncE